MFQIVNHSRDEFSLTSDPSKIDTSVVYTLLSTSYWAKNRSRTLIDKSIQNSLCFSIFDKDKQIGFARIVTDGATFAYLCDIIIDPTYRGHGLGQWVMSHILDHPDIKDLRRRILVTKDAQVFYEKFGFNNLENPGKYMEMVKG